MRKLHWAILRGVGLVGLVALCLAAAQATSTGPVPSPGAQSAVSDAVGGPMRAPAATDGAPGIAQSCSSIGPSGGTVSGENGEILTVPAGALPGVAEICISTLTEGQFGELVGIRPDSNRFLGGVQLDMQGYSFSLPATLSIPGPSGGVGEEQVLVGGYVNTGEILGAGLSLLAEGYFSQGTGQLITDAGDVLPGIRHGGAVAFEAIELPLGFVSGIAEGTDGMPMDEVAVAVIPADAASAATEAGTLQATGTVGYLYMTDPSGRFYLPLEAGAESRIIGIADVPGEIIGGVTDIVVGVFKDWLYRQLEMDDPDAEHEIAYELEIDCSSPVVVYGMPGYCQATGIQTVTLTIHGIPFTSTMSRVNVTDSTQFSGLPAGIVSVSRGYVFALRPGSVTILAVHLLYGTATDSVDCLCGDSYVECSGACYQGDCCTDDDCPEGRTCVNHSCRGWESRPLSASPSALLLDGRELSATRAARHLVMPAPFAQDVPISAVVPQEGPSGTHPITQTLTAAYAGLTNAVEAFSVDFVDDESSKVRAEVFVLKTLNGPYNHDYAVCERFHGAVLEGVYPQLHTEPTGDQSWFWHCRLDLGPATEEAIVFTVLVDKDADPPAYLVDSRWLDENYYPDPIYPPYDYMLNYQVWTRGPVEEATALVQRTTEVLSSHGEVTYRNTSDPGVPSAFIREASYSDQVIHLMVQSLAEGPTDAEFFGTTRPYSDTTASVPFSFTRQLTLGINTVDLPVGEMVDGVVLAKIGGFLDKVYVGGGFWFGFRDSDSEVTTVGISCSPEPGVAGDGLAVSGCYHVTGTVALPSGHVGIGRVFNPSGQPVDVSGYQALSFYAMGNGKSYRVQIETEDVENYDYHQYVITPPLGEWKQFVIPLSQFTQQGWGASVALTGADVKSVSWVSLGPMCDGEVDLAVDRVAFLKADVVTNTLRPVSTNDVSGPYEVRFEVSPGTLLTAQTLYFGVNGSEYQSAPLRDEDGALIGEVPGQPMDSEIRYYFEGVDYQGNVIRDPADAPARAHSFRVEWYPSLLVDDFSDPNPANVLGGLSSTFRDLGQGGVITPCYPGGVLSLGFDVTGRLPGTDEYAGYFSELLQTDGSSYNSVALDVRGASGGEVARLELGDSQANTPKIELGEYLSKGITREWQTVRIPLHAFAQIADPTQLRDFALIFEEHLEGGQGTIYIDGLRLNPAAVPVAVANFNSRTDVNGVGGSHSTFSGGGASIATGFDGDRPFGGMGASLVITYSGVTTSDYAAWQTALNGVDVTSYQTLTLAYRSAQVADGIHLYLEDAASRRYVSISDYIGASEDWQVLSIPLSLFSGQGVDLADLQHLQLAFEWQDMAGTVWLDDIRFEPAPPPVIVSLSPSWTGYGLAARVAVVAANVGMTPTLALGYHVLNNVTKVSGSQWEATTPATLPAGVYDLKLMMPNMQGDVLSQAFRVRQGVYLPLVVRQ